MSFLRYPVYKDSGVEWLGEVPADWKISSLKRQAKLLTEKSDRRNNPIGLENVESWSGRQLTTETEFQGDGVAFERGDILFGKLRPYLAKVLLARESGEAVGDFHVLRPSSELISSFLAHAIRNREFIAIVDGSTYGAKMPRASWEYMGSMLVAVPPISEQTAIAGFLDRETAKIDALVAEQQNLIALLKEKRQALISHAVTKGLDPDVRMKDSGVAWLGEVPAHWVVLALSRIATERCDGPFGSGIKSEHYTDSGALVVRLQNIRSNGFYVGEPAFLEFEYFEQELKRHEVVPGDVLIAGLGDENNVVGRACVAPAGISPALVKADCFRFRLDGGVVAAAFVAAQLNVSAVADAGRLANGSTRSRIPLSVMATRVIALPSLAEQVEIVAFAERERAAIDELINEAETTIALLRERRTALISAAVTGKIDVRHIAVASAIPTPEPA